MKIEGIIHVAKNVDDEFYSAMYIDVPLYSDTGGLYFENPNTNRKEYVKHSDNRIKSLRINGIIIKS